MLVQNKILIISLSLATIISIALAVITDSYPGNGFFYIMGLVSITGGLSCTALGLLLLLKKDKSRAKGCLLSSTLLLTIGLSSYFLLHAC